MGNANGKQSPNDQDGVFRRLEQHVQGRTKSGLLALVPVLVTAIVIYFIVDKADAFLRPMLANIEVTVGTDLDTGADRTIRPLDFPGVGIIAAVLIFYFLGLLVSAGLGLEGNGLDRRRVASHPQSSRSYMESLSRRPRLSPRSTISAGSSSWSGPGKG